MNAAPTGRRLCGSVRSSVRGAPLLAVLCQCRDCQRASGGGHMPVLGMPSDGLEVEGPVSAFASPGGSGSDTVRNFCRTCGSTLYGTPEGFPDMVTIYAGSLDDKAAFVPTASVHTARRQPWDTGGQFLDQES